MNAPEDFYTVLGVDRDADETAIKRGYRQACKTAHPDKGGSKERMQLVNQAYACLSDPERRAIYDATGVDQPEGHQVKGLMETIVEGQALELLRDGFKANITITDDRKLLRQLRGGLQERIAEAVEKKATAQGTVTSTSKRLGRMTVKEGRRNLVEELLVEKIDAANRAIDDADHDLLVFKAALKLLDDYGTNQPEPKPEPQRFAQGRRYFELDEAFFSGFNSTFR